MKKSLPTIEKDGYRLGSGVKLHKEAPKTFWIPSEEAKSKVGGGDIVKLPFEIRIISVSGQEEFHGERMWVIVLSREGDWFTGILDNQPVCTDDIKPGLVVQFNSEHIINISDEGIDLESEEFKRYQKESQI